MIILEDSKNDTVDKLVVSYKFPPDNDISGIVVAKRIINNDSMVDVIHNDDLNNKFLNTDIVDDFINERLTTSIKSERDAVEGILNFINQGMSLIDKREYDHIYSRSWYMSNHYLALEYKFSHPDAYWTAEFSDPVLVNVYGKIRTHSLSVFDNKNYIDKVNLKIEEHNRVNLTAFNPINNPDNSFYMAEYLTFIFADEIIFSNNNQRKIILDNHDEDIKQLVMDKSKIMPHPTLDDKYYHLADVELELNEEDINIAYFGNYYYASRHFEPLFFAFESLNHKYKDRIKFHLFINENEFLDILIGDLEFKDNILIKEPLNYIEFLNATTKFDILLINDMITSEYFDINPFLPSKLSDYLGSGRDIWALFEDESTLSAMDFKYKSSMTDYKQSREVLLKILNDHGYEDNEYSFNDTFYEKRINQLNNVIDKQNELNKKYKSKIDQLNRANKKLAKQNNELLLSNSWKITEPLRKFGSAFKK